jgi:hypothetical protein
LGGGVVALQHLRNPHFDLPFRFQGGAVAAVEQDTYNDVANCVEAIVRTPFGYRYDAPDFGLTDMVFDLQPLDTESVLAAIETQEPRADVLVEENPDFYDVLIARMTIELLPTEE